jgi:uncharacterized protein YcfJ
MKRSILIVVLLPIMFFSVSCATKQPDRYNTQKGAAIGAGAGALMGQAIGGDSEGALKGAVVGTLIGAISGNALDQEHQAARDTARTNNKVVNADKSLNPIETIPVQNGQQTNCRKVTKRQWDNGHMISETVEEICEGEKITQNY